VVALAGVALRVLVGQARSLRLEDGLAHDVLGRDQLEVVLLALGLAPDGGEDRRIGALEGRHRSAPSARRVPSSRSSAAIWSTRRWCRPPAKGVSRKMRTSSRAWNGATSPPPSTSTFASLCSRAMRAESASVTSAARTPGNLFATIDMP